MELQVKKYKKFTRDVKFMLAGSGLWPNYKKHPRVFRILLSVCSVFASASTTCGICAFCIKNITNINVVTRGIGLMISFLTVFLKVTILLTHQKDLQSLNEGISAYFEEDLKDPKLRKHLLAHFSTFSKVFNTYIYSVGISVMLLAITPLSMLRHGKYVRMYPQLLPFEYEPGGALHWLIYGYELFCDFYLWSVSSGSDCLFGLYALHMTGELRLLSDRFRNLKSSFNYKEDLKECIDRHLLLMNSRYKLQRVYGFLAIWLAITCAIALCTVVFQATNIKNITVLRICYLAGHCFLKLVQAYSYAWYGNIIAVESELCLMSMYDSQWPDDGDKCFMNDVLIVISQKPMIFNAMGCMYLGLDMFSKIVHTSVSYFFLLQTLEEKS